MCKIAATIGMFLLSGCSGMLTIPEEGRFEPENWIAKSTITWIVSNDPTATCKQLFPALRHRLILPACAGWDDDICTIVTGSVTTHQLLGHEVRHCFEGNFHD